MSVSRFEDGKEAREGKAALPESDQWEAPSRSRHRKGTPRTNGWCMCYLPLPVFRSEGKTGLKADPNLVSSVFRVEEGKEARVGKAAGKRPIGSPKPEPV